MTKTVITVELLAGERQSSESDNAVIACNDWLRMGPGRTLAGLVVYYQDKSNIIKHFKPASTSLKTLQTWSSRFSWAERASGFDASWDAIKTAERTAELGYGLALDFERVKRLKRLADFLETQLYERGTDGDFHNVWMPDVKVVGHGEDAEAIDIERFNSALIIQYRETLNDLAAEVGGRVKKAEVSGPDGTPIPISVVKMDVDEL